MLMDPCPNPAVTDSPSSPALPSVRAKEATDALLMHRAMDRDLEAFAELFRRHAGKIYRVAFLMLHDESGAEDVAQETFTRALQQIESFRGDSEPVTWFYSIGLNVCRRALRHQKHHESSAEIAILDQGRPLADFPRGVLTSVYRRELTVRLAIAMGYLTEAQQEVFALHYIEGMPFQSVSEILNISLSAALSLGHRARGVLAAKLPHLLGEIGAES